MAALDFATGLIDPENQSGKASVASLHPDIAGENPGHIFILCMLIASIFESSQYASGRRAIATAVIKPKNLAAGARAVLNWPDGLVDILTRSGTFRSANAESDAQSFAGMCKHSGVLKTSLSDAVQKVVMLARMGTQQPRFLRRLEVVSSDSPSEEAVEIAHFSAISGSGPFKEAVRLTKLPPLVLYDCYLMGLCGPEAANPNEIVSQILRWASTMLFRHARQTEKLSKAISIRRCVASIYLGDGDIWPAVIKAMQCGHLPVKAKQNAPRLIESLFVDDLDDWVEFLTKEQGITTTNCFPLNSTEVAFYFDMSVGAAQTLFDFKSRLTFTDLQTFRRENILLDHLSCIAATQGERLNRDLLYRRLNAAGLRSRGDRFVDRSKALRHLELD